MQRRITRQRLPHLMVLALAVLLVLGTSLPGVRAQTASVTRVYNNPLKPQIPNDGIVESCADPSLIRGQQAGDTNWYMYCTTDPLNDEDRTGDTYNFHKVPMLQSSDLVNWTYVGDAFSTVPAWGEPTAGIWAPEIDYFNGKYYLYYGVTDVKASVSGAPNCGGDNAIGVATSDSPTGPWTDLGRPVIEPRYNGDPNRAFGNRECNFFWTFDPEVIVDDSGQAFIYYGSYYGGIFARELDDDFVTADPATEVQITIANRYEGAEVVQYNDYYYLFVSAANCCNGPLTGYSVFAGRSTSPRGPFVDREGVSLLTGRVGGTPVISMNGNRWVGPGHNSVFQDAAGQWWTVYHAVDRFDPYFTADPGFTKRPALLDPIEWVKGWPMVRGGLWASDEPQPGPAAQTGDPAQNRNFVQRMDEPFRQLEAFSDEFNGTSLGSQWAWVRQPTDATTYGVENGSFRFNTQAADLFVDNNSASVLTRPTPGGDYIVETKVTLNLPAEGCCFNYVQAGLVIYGSDDAFIKLVHFSNWETRQTEFAKEVPPPVPTDYPRYGNTVVGPPNLTTWLRIVKRTQGNEEAYTAYTSRDGRNWVRGGTWTHNLGADAKIGLVAMGRNPDNPGGLPAAFTANFDYVRVYSVEKHVYLPVAAR